MSGYDPRFPEDPTREEDEASMSSLALAPWVESQAKPLRDAHMAARRSELEVNVRSKVWKWRFLDRQPREGFHRR